VQQLLLSQIPKPYLAACSSSSSSSLRALAQMHQPGRRGSACEQPRKLRMLCLSWRLARPCCNEHGTSSENLACTTTKSHAGWICACQQTRPHTQSAFALLCRVLQESRAQATRLLDQARQWFGYITGVTEILGSQPCLRLPSDMSWLVLRPVLRLLLWLVPEHAPQPMTVAAAAQPQSVSSGSAMQGRGKHNKASTSMSEDWRCSLVLAYIRDVATVGDSSAAGLPQTSIMHTGSRVG
jgi:hypothetical protein